MSITPVASQDGSMSLDENKNYDDAQQISEDEFEVPPNKQQQALNIATVAQGWLVTMRSHKYTHALLQDIDTHCTNALMLASKLEAIENAESQIEPVETSSADQMLENISIRHSELKATVDTVMGRNA